VKEYRHYRGKEPPLFAHESEREVAGLLDEAGIPWMYEPRMFVLEEDDGTIVQGFTPDFYLPDADVYLECTTARQSLTTRKNGKIRKLRARGEVVAVHYRRDLERLLRRYGRPATPRTGAIRRAARG
jgi:hypoxanthine phosphoribosyltransferase